MSRHPESNGRDRISGPARDRRSLRRGFRTGPGPLVGTFRPSMIWWAVPIVLGVLAVSGSPSAWTVEHSPISVSDVSRRDGSLVLERTGGRSRVQASPLRPIGFLLDGEAPETFGSYEKRTSNQSESVGPDGDIGPSQVRPSSAELSYFALRAAIARGGFLSSPSRAPPSSFR